MYGGRYVPNRIFRGKIVEALRDASLGIDAEKIGRSIAVDWDLDDHHEWLNGLLEGLVRDQMIVKKEKKYRLHE